uniref:Uncharacterized protein n=1 Tax=Romanomermis culicivorax TaxID=13658 RepID=A0A915L401_ROMCU
MIGQQIGIRIGALSATTIINVWQGVDKGHLENAVVLSDFHTHAFFGTVQLPKWYKNLHGNFPNTDKPIYNKGLWDHLSNKHSAAFAKAKKEDLSIKKAKIEASEQKSKIYQVVSQEITCIVEHDDKGNNEVESSIVSPTES